MTDQPTTLLERATDERVSAILRTDNPNDPSGQWSVWDIRRETNLSEEGIRASLARVCPGGGRYVGGTSQYLYDLPYREDNQR